MRPRAKLLAVAATALLGAGLVYTVQQASESPSPVATRMHTVSQGAGDTGAPAWLPSNAHLKSEAGELKAPGAVFRQYGLSGPANADTLTPAALASGSSSAHPRTEISVSFVPHFAPPPLPADPEWFITRAVDLNGVSGTVTYAKNGLGATRVDWVDVAGNYHVVLEDRLQTRDGVSGVDVDTLLRIARSIGA